MAVIILPSAQVDLLSLQDYMLEKWSEASWLKAEDDIFDKLAKVDAGLFNGTAGHRQDFPTLLMKRLLKA